MTFTQLVDCPTYYALFYIYTYKLFILTHLLLVSLNTTNVIINIGLRLLIKMYFNIRVKEQVNCNVL